MIGWLLVVALVSQSAPVGSPRPHPAPSPVPNCFPAEAHLDEFRTQWYCAHVLAGGQSRLAGDKAYRFIYLPTFDHPRIVTLSQHGADWIIAGRVLSGRGGYQPGKVSRSTERKLSTAEARLLEQRLQNAAVWGPDSVRDDRGLDGSMWLLEAKNGPRYLLHEVWSPRDNTFPQYRKACAYMLELAGVMPESDEGELY